MHSPSNNGLNRMSTKQQTLTYLSPTFHRPWLTESMAMSPWNKPGRSSASSSSDVSWMPPVGVGGCSTSGTAGLRIRVEELTATAAAPSTDEYGEFGNAKANNSATSTTAEGWDMLTNVAANLMRGRDSIAVLRRTVDAMYLAPQLSGHWIE